MKRKRKGFYDCGIFKCQNQPKYGHFYCSTHADQVKCNFGGCSDIKERPNMESSLYCITHKYFFCLCGEKLQDKADSYCLTCRSKRETCQTIKSFKSEQIDIHVHGMCIYIYQETDIPQDLQQKIEQIRSIGGDISLHWGKYVEEKCSGFSSMFRGLLGEDRDDYDD